MQRQGGAAAPTVRTILGGPSGKVRGPWPRAGATSWQSRLPVFGVDVRLREAGGMAFGFDRLFIVDRGSHVVHQYDDEGTVRTVVGTGEAGATGDGGPATDATLCSPSGIAADVRGALWIADSGNHVIRRVNAKGRISTVAGPADAVAVGDGDAPPPLSWAIELLSPRDVAVAGDNMLAVAEPGRGRVVRMEPDGRIQEITGGRGPGAPRGGLRRPVAVAFTPVGALLVADTGHRAVFQIDPDGAWTRLGGVRGRPVGVAMAWGSEVIVLDGDTGAVEIVEPSGHVRVAVPGLAAPARRSRLRSETPAVGLLAYDGASGAVAMIRAGEEPVVEVSRPIVEPLDPTPRSRRAWGAPRPGPTAPSAHVFVFGCQRTGTSAMVRLLQAHEQVVVGQERYRRRYSRYRSSRMLSPPVGPKHFLHHRFFDFDPADTEATIERNYNHYRDAWSRYNSGNLVYSGDKLGHTTAVVESVAAAFPEARFVFTYRELLATASSFVVRADDPRDLWPSNNRHELALEHWAESFKTAQWVIDNLGADRLFVVRQDVLQAESEELVDRLFDGFLGLDPAGFEAGRKIERPASSGGSRGLALTAEEQAWLLERADISVMTAFDDLMAKQLSPPTDDGWLIQGAAS